MRGVCALGMILLTGCYYRTRFGPDGPPVGSSVRVTLTPAASRSLTDVIGDRVHVLDGRTVRGSRDSLSIAVTRIGRFDDSGVKWNGETVTLPRVDVLAVERRELSAPMTALMVGSALMATVLAAKALGKPVINYK